MQNDVNYSQFRDKLISKKINLLERLERIEDSKSRKEGFESDSEEQVSILQNDQVVDKLDEIERKELNLINDALDRIADGSYGVCEECGEIINPKRLIALPFAKLCINCAE